MKKTLYILSALLLVLVSCNEAEFDPNGSDGSKMITNVEPTGLVAVKMQVEVPAVLMAQTRALGDRSDLPSIKSIRVAVFGTSGYPQAYALAEPVDADGNLLTSYATTNYNETTPQKYYFKVLLPVYEGEAFIHIIANGPEDIPFVDQDEESIMATMKTENNVGAFWARVYLEDGILPTKDDHGIMTTDNEGNFFPDDNTAKAFKDLVLIRNFAEVILLNESEDISNITWTLVNVPTSGSVAPMAAGTFVDDFKDYTYNEEDGTMVNGTKTYEGFMFTGEDAMDFTVPDGNAITTPIADPLFVYERRHPGEEMATCVLMKASFQGGPLTYYRLDLMDESVGGYFPLYRNYKYQVKIHKVGNPGASTPAEAMNRNSGGNVSLSYEARKLTDISDGTSRLFVEYVEKNFTSGGKKELWVQYVPDVTKDEDNDGKADVDNTNVSISIKTQGNALVPDTEITKLAKSTVDGYYFYEFELNEQDENSDLTSVLEVKAHNGETGDDKSTLYRDITLRVMKKMNMTLSFVPKKVSGVGTETVLNIALPDGLPSSMFPLEIHIEDINHTLSPTQKDGNGNSITVPVQTALSLADGKTNSFRYIRTVNETEYNQNHTITTTFKTIQGASATTIYVANEYFKTQTVNLLNNGMYVNPTNATVDFNVKSVIVEVEFDDESQNKTWTVGNLSSNVQITYTDSEGNPLFEGDEENPVPVTSGTGNGYFKMTFPENNSTTAVVKRLATVTDSDGASQTVTITQSILEFSVEPATQEVAFNTTKANVTVYAPEGKAWTATVSTGASLTGNVEGVYSGEGTVSLEVVINDVNRTSDQKPFTVTATMTDPALTATARVIQKRGPNPSSSFTEDSFSYNGGDRTGTGTSGDEFISISFTNIGNDSPNRWNSNSYYRRTGPTVDDYIALGYRTGYYYNYTPHGGTITVTPAAGIKITRITITYTSATYGSYDTDYNTGSNQAVSVSTGSYSRSGATGTWTGPSTDPIVFTNGYRLNNGEYYFPRITDIVVTYEPV